MIKDKLFLLSKTEVEKYFKDDEERIRCGWHGTGFDEDISPEAWWLRTPSEISDYILDTIGEWGYNSADIHLLINAVCPALHLKPGFLSKLPRYGNKYVQFGKDPVTEAPLSWIILDEGTELIHAIDVLGYHKFDWKITDYEKSEIRKYINEELMPKLFTEKELSMISYTLIHGEKSIRVFEKNVELAKENKEDKSISDISDGVKKVSEQLEVRAHKPGSTIAADVGTALENISTKDLIAYCSFKFGEAFVRNWAEGQIIADEINKEGEKAYSNRFTSTMRNHDTQKRKGR